jgi:antitoxin (DNA-binding transcriptional repressor) of toxin-antitoxin stability system
MYISTIHFMGGLMQASILDLRYHMKEILQALKRNETVDILYHGKHQGTIIPYHAEKKKLNTKEHAYFGMSSSKQKSVAKQMEELRGGRFNDI